MQVFEYNQKWLIWLGLSSNRLHEPTNDFYKSINAYIMLITMTISMPICGTYGLYRSRGYLEEMFQAFYIVSAGIQCVGSYMAVGNNMKLVKSLINDLQTISDNGNFVLNFQKSHLFSKFRFFSKFQFF